MVDRPTRWIFGAEMKDPVLATQLELEIRQLAVLHVIDVFFETRGGHMVAVLPAATRPQATLVCRFLIKKKLRFWVDAEL